jgi:hypothetical protein
VKRSVQFSIPNRVRINPPSQQPFEVTTRL